MNIKRHQVIDVERYFSAGIIMGQLSDRFGRRHLMLVNQFGSFLCMLIPAFIPDYWSATYTHNTQ